MVRKDTLSFYTIPFLLHLYKRYNKHRHLKGAFVGFVGKLYFAVPNPMATAYIFV